MGVIKPPELVLLFVSTLDHREEICNQSKVILESNFGDILYLSPSLTWDYSSYYKNEIGWPLFRQIIFFKNLIDPALLVDIKIKANEIESVFTRDDKRQINLD